MSYKAIDMKRFCVAFCITFLLQDFLLGHDVHELSSSDGFLEGFSHPVLGFDHLLAMISVGILSALMGGKAIWSVPLTFVSVMLVGGILGIYNVPLFSVEKGIAFSVLALGVVIAAGKEISTFSAMIFIAIFAIFHGHAHGTEMPYLAKPEIYALGFISGTTGIHIAGVLIGIFSKKLKYGVGFLRFSGVGIAGIGLYYCFV